MTGQATGQLSGRVAANIRAAQEFKGLNNQQLAHALEIGEKSVRRWRSGEVTPNEENLGRLAEVLGIGDLSWFYLDHGNQKAAA